MRLKIAVIILALAAILALLLFGSGIRDTAINGLADDVDEYNCDGTICTSCIIGGDICSCGPDTCDCGNMTIDRGECSLS